MIKTRRGLGSWTEAESLKLELKIGCQGKSVVCLNWDIRGWLVGRRVMGPGANVNGRMNTDEVLAESLGHQIPSKSVAWVLQLAADSHSTAVGSWGGPLSRWGNEASSPGVFLPPEGVEKLMVKFGLKIEPFIISQREQVRGGRRGGGHNAVLISKLILTGGLCLGPGHQTASAFQLASLQPIIGNNSYLGVLGLVAGGPHPSYQACLGAWQP